MTPLDITPLIALEKAIGTNLTMSISKEYRKRKLLAGKLIYCFILDRSDENKYRGMFNKCNKLNFSQF